MSISEYSNCVGAFHHSCSKLLFTLRLAWWATSNRFSVPAIDADILKDDWDGVNSKEVLASHTAALFGSIKPTPSDWESTRGAQYLSQHMAGEWEGMKVFFWGGRGGSCWEGVSRSGYKGDEGNGTGRLFQWGGPNEKLLWMAWVCGLRWTSGGVGSTDLYFSIFANCLMCSSIDRQAVIYKQIKISLEGTNASMNFFVRLLKRGLECSYPCVGFPLILLLFHILCVCRCNEPTVLIIPPFANYLFRQRYVHKWHHGGLLVHQSAS